MITPPASTTRPRGHDFGLGLVLVLALFALMTALLAVVPSRAAGETFQDVPQSRALPTLGPILVAEPGDNCLDVVFIGARGSGEQYNLKDYRGLGETINPALSAYVVKMAGYRVGFHPLPYPAYDVALLAQGKAVKFFAGLEQGRKSLWTFLKDRAGACPDERYVLAGYSQGAMVVHRVMWQLAESKHRALANRIDGLLLVADGDRIAKEGGEHYGSSDNTNATQVGLTFTVSAWRAWGTPLMIAQVGAHEKKVPAQFATSTGTGFVRWHSVCKTNDNVCDTGSALAAGKDPRDGDIHSSYRDVKYDRHLVAARQIAKASRLTKPRAPFGLASATAPTAIAGNPYSWTMTPVGAKPPYTVVAGPGFPTTLTVNALTHTITGVPTTVGNMSLPVTITDALNRSVNVTVSLTVTPGDIVASPPPTPPATPTLPLPPATLKLPAAAYADDYRFALSSAYPYAGTWSVVSGSLPPGLSLGSDGTVSGVAEQTLTPTDYTFTAQHLSPGGTPVTTDVTIPHHGWNLSWGCAQVAGNVPGQPPYVGATGQLFGWFHAPGDIGALPTVERIGVVRLNSVDYPLQAGPGVTANRVALHLDYGVVYDLKVFVSGKLFLHDEDVRVGEVSQCTIVSNFPFPFTN